VVEFDTTEQGYKLREAEADLAEAEQQVIRAKAESQAKGEEDQLALHQARSEVKLAELDVRKNELLARIVARQNELALETARDHLRQLEQDLSNRKATSLAGIAIQEAARNKAKTQSETARRNIESMTLRAKTRGYVSIQQNMNSNMYYTGMQLPMLQLGDTVRAGMAVAQIPDLDHWEVTARIAELDRGHLALNQKASITVPALPGRTFSGHITNLGGTVGPPWDRRFECKIALNDPSPELRPGMSAVIVVTTETLPRALWIPAQALFEADGRTFVYVRTAGGFVPQDVKLVRRSESQVVLTGLAEGRHVALASPDQKSGKKDTGSGALQALPKS